MRFVLIDRLLELEPGRRVVASKTFGAGEEFLQDHFPGLPLVPGVLLTEAMSQAAGWMLLAGGGFRSWPLLVVIDKAKFRRPVRPGEDLRIVAALESSQPRDHRVHARVESAGQRLAEARLLFHCFDPDGLGEIGGSPGTSLEVLAWARRVFRELGGETWPQADPGGGVS